MAQQTFNNGESGVDVRTKLNANANDAETRLDSLEIAVPNKADQSALNAHVGDTANPHGVTKAQVGLSAVDNTSDMDKPLSTDQKSYVDMEVGDNTTLINNHINDDDNPHSTTKAHVGLGNVDNTSDANKPISNATSTALSGKEPTISPKETAFNRPYGAAANTVCEGNDERLSIYATQGVWNRAETGITYSTTSVSFQTTSPALIRSCIIGQAYKVRIGYRYAETNNLFLVNKHVARIHIDGSAIGSDEIINGFNSSDINNNARNWIEANFVATAVTHSIDLRHRCDGSGTVYTRDPIIESYRIA